MLFHRRSVKSMRVSLCLSGVILRFWLQGADLLKSFDSKGEGEAKGAALLNLNPPDSSFIHGVKKLASTVRTLQLSTLKAELRLETAYFPLASLDPGSHRNSGGIAWYRRVPWCIYPRNLVLRMAISCLGSGFSVDCTLFVVRGVSRLPCMFSLLHSQLQLRNPRKNTSAATFEFTTLARF